MRKSKGEKSSKQLHLNKETLRRLEVADLRQVDGGSGDSKCCSFTNCYASIQCCHEN